jgi:Xaa-Pro aminopeptidase
MNPVSDRLRALRGLMRQNSVPDLLVTSPANRRYYSGFEAGDTLINESSGALLVTGRGQYLLTDSRYTEAARAQAPSSRSSPAGAGWPVAWPPCPPLNMPRPCTWNRNS